MIPASEFPRSQLARFQVVDSLRTPRGHLSGLSDQDKKQLADTVRAIQVDAKVLINVSIEYLSSMKASSEEVAIALIRWIEKNPDFKASMFCATRDAIVFSTLAPNLAPEAFRFAMTTLERFRWTQLEKMRHDLFALGVDTQMQEVERASDARLRLPAARTNSETFLARR